MNKNQIKGKSDSIKGKFKEIIGRLFGKRKLETEGKKQKLVGEAESAVGLAEENLKQAGR